MKSIRKPTALLNKNDVVVDELHVNAKVNKGSPTRDRDSLSQMSVRSLIRLRNRVNELLDHRLSREIPPIRVAQPPAIAPHPMNRAARRLVVRVEKATQVVQDRLDDPINTYKSMKSILADAFKDPLLRCAKFPLPPSNFLPACKATLESWSRETPIVEVPLPMADPVGEYTVDYTPVTHLSVRVKLRMMKSFVVRPIQNPRDYVVHESVPTSPIDYQMEYRRSPSLRDNPQPRLILLRTSAQVYEDLSRQYGERLQKLLTIRSHWQLP